MLDAKRVLVDVAHPDDEALGCGGTIRRLASSGAEVHLCVMSGSVTARTQRPSDENLMADIAAAQRLLGITSVTLGEFDNIKFNVVPHLSLVQFVERSIRSCQPDVVLTHHPSDLNNDHVQTSIACQAAIRLPQRTNDLSPIGALYFMEVLSATDWSVAGAALPFAATTFVNITETVSVKIQAVEAYRGVLRPPPHPRST